MNIQILVVVQSDTDNQLGNGRAAEVSLRAVKPKRQM